MQSDFATLRIPEGASAEVARRARNTFARNTHQKQCQGDKNAIEAMARVNAAFDRIKAGKPRLTAEDAPRQESKAAEKTRQDEPRQPRAPKAGWQADVAMQSLMERRIRFALLNTHLVREDVQPSEFAGIHFATRCELVSGIVHYYCDTRPLPGTNVVVLPRIKLTDRKLSMFHIYPDAYLLNATIDHPIDQSTHLISMHPTSWGKNIPAKVHFDPNGGCHRSYFADRMRELARYERLQSVRLNQFAQANGIFGKMKTFMGLAA